jgi:hypothetical protein
MEADTRSSNKRATGRLGLGEYLFELRYFPMSMTSGVRHWWVFGTLLGTAPAAWAEVSCPDRIEVDQRVEAPDGWSASYSEANPRLAGIALFDGPPANRVKLKHDQARQGQRELVLRWNLRDTPRTHYLQCSYDRTSAVLTTALPPGVRQCELVFERGNTIPGGSMPVKRMFCR